MTRQGSSEGGFSRSLSPNQTPPSLFCYGGPCSIGAKQVSVTGFVQQIACTYLRHGYWFYVTGIIPQDKDPRAVDEKLIKKYDIAVSESTRGRRKRLGKANLQYLRYQNFFVILATEGIHQFKLEEADRLRDIRRVPLKFHGYSISYRRGGRTLEGEVDPEVARPCRDRAGAVQGDSRLSARLGDSPVGEVSRTILLRNPIRALRAGPAAASEHPADRQSGPGQGRVLACAFRSPPTSSTGGEAV